jgi:hypothetical protein
MYSDNLNILIGKIMNTPPYQLPPVVHGEGCFLMDITYRGHPVNKVGFSLEECLQSYYDHVSKVNYMNNVQPRQNLVNLPVGLGKEIG